MVGIVIIFIHLFLLALSVILYCYFPLNKIIKGFLEETVYFLFRSFVLTMIIAFPFVLFLK